MHCKNLKFFMSLCDSCRRVAGIAAAAFLAVAAAHATPADSIAAGKSLAVERGTGY